MCVCVCVCVNLVLCSNKKAVMNHSISEPASLLQGRGGREGRGGVTPIDSVVTTATTSQRFDQLFDEV